MILRGEFRLRHESPANALSAFNVVLSAQRTLGPIKLFGPAPSLIYGISLNTYLS